MIIATTESVAGHRVTQTLGQVFGLVVRSRGLGGNVMAGLRSLAGGEITEYTEMLEEARRYRARRAAGIGWQTTGERAYVDAGKAGNS